ncbi:MAG: hypothetical protein AAGF11_33915 [Myxococcota bacterium]
MPTSLLPRVLLLPLTAALGAGCLFDPDRTSEEALGDSTGETGSSAGPASDGADEPPQGDGSSDDPSATGDGPGDDSDDGLDGSDDDDASDPCGGTCEHGTCSAQGTCDCDPGWEGPTCAQNIDDCVDVDCGQGTCVDDVDAFACACDPGWEGQTCDALQMPLCLRGPLTVTNAFEFVNGHTATGAFEHLELSPVDLSLEFEISHTYPSFGNGELGQPSGSLTTIETASLAVRSTDPFLDAVFGAAYGDTAQDLVLVNGPTIGLDLGNMVSPSGAEYWGLETSSVLPLPLLIDQTGFPAILPSPGAGSGAVVLRRYQSGNPLMTDFAQAQWEPALLNGAACR